MTREIDRKLIQKMSKKQLEDFIFLHLRNMWTVDGLYYLGIEEKYGTNVATEIDRKVWETMGKIEARRLKELLRIKGNDIPSVLEALQYSGWALDLEDKEIIINKEKGVVRNIKCRVQNTRKIKGLNEFGCKHVRWSFLKSFVREFNPNIIVNCIVCPPDNHPENLWCEWEFILKEK